MKKSVKVEKSILWHRIARVLKWIPTLFISVLLITFALFQVPKIQTRLLNELSDFIAQNTSFRLSIGHANLTWYDEFLFDNVRLYQRANDSTLVHIDNMTIDVGIWHYLIHREIKGDQLTLKSPSVHIIKPNDSTEMNINLFITELTSVLSKTKNEKSTAILIDEIVIQGGRFSVNQMSADSVKEGKDFNHFEFRRLNTHVSEFMMEGDSIGLQIDSLQADDPSSTLDIASMKGQFWFTGRHLGLTQLQLHTNYSYLSDSIVLKYNSPGQLSSFIDSIEFDAHLKNTKIDTRDLELFDAKATKLGQRLDVSGHFTGSVGKLTAKNLQLAIGNSRVYGQGFFNGLPEISETFIDFHFRNSTINPQDISQVVSKPILEKMGKLGKVEIDGFFSGFTTNFVTNGTLLTDVGKVETDINLRIDRNNTAHYEGRLVLNQFELSKVFSELNNIKKISLNGNINGRGLEVNNAHFELNANIDSVQLDKFDLTNITVSSRFEKQFLNGDFSISDPKLAFKGAVEVDLREGNDKFKINADLDTLDLYAMGYFDEPLQMSTHIDVNMKGLKIDEMRGYFNLKDSKVKYKNNQLNMDSIRFLSIMIGNIREISLSTDDLSAQLIGNYTNTQLLSGFTQIYKEVLINLENDSARIQQYYEAKKLESVSKLVADLNVNMRDVNQYIQPFYPEFYVSKDVNIKCRLSQDSITTLSFYSSIDSVKFKDQAIYLTDFDLNISKDFYDKDLLASLTLESSKQQWHDNFETENINTEIIWDKSLMTFWTSINQPAYQNDIILSGEINFYNDNTTIHMVPVPITLLNNEWNWIEENSIVLTQESVEFTNFGITHVEQTLEATGVYGSMPDEILSINLTQVNIQNFQRLFPFSIEGEVDGYLNIKKENDKNLYESDLTARGLMMKNYLVGNLFVSSEWNHDNESIQMEIDLARNGVKKIEVLGDYHPFKTDNELDFAAQFFDADLQAFDPLIQKNFTNLRGNLSGQATIKGKLSQPIMNGSVTLQDGHVKINYLNTSYLVNGTVMLEDQSFVTDNLNLTDMDGHSATFRGSVRHEGLTALYINLDGNFQNFKLLNTNSVDNKLYYGSAYATGNVSFRGSNHDLFIGAKVRSEKGTKLFLPIGQSKNHKAGQKEYIQFMDLSKTTNQTNPIAEALKEEAKIKGIRLDFDLELTTDAYIELIFDIKAGDIIRGRGEGNLNLFINSDGDFSMLGDYAIDHGGYNFTLYNIINKEFAIKKGSTIAWYGNPYGAILNIEAQYKQLTSLLPILTDVPESQQNLIELRRKYPAIVELKLTENLLSPRIVFDINVTDYPQRITVSDGTGPFDLESHVNAFKTKIRNNEQEMNRQVFSLLILRKFSPENSFQVNSETIGSSLSEFVSNQLSYWATQVDENLEIDVDLTSLDEDAFDTFQLRLSYTFLDGRLKVTRGGGIPNDETSDNIYSFIGDWSVEYLLTEDGRFRAKVYSRADLNPIDRVSNPNSVETGFSLQFVRSFDELSEILRDKRSKEKDKVTEDSVQ